MISGFLITFTLLIAISPAAAQSPISHAVVDGQFQVNGKAIPPGCLQRLMTGLNGDDVTAAVFLTRTDMRGCMAANVPSEIEDVIYEIIDNPAPSTYVVRVCEPVDGTMGRYCGSLLIAFKSRDYRKPNGQTVRVLAVEKLGEN